MCNNLHVHKHTYEFVLCKHMKMCPKVQQILPPNLNLHGGFHLFPNVWELM